MQFLTDLGASLARGDVLHDPLMLSAAALGLLSLLLTFSVTADLYRPWRLGLALDSTCVTINTVLWLDNDPVAHGWAPAAVFFGLSALVTIFRHLLRALRERHHQSHITHAPMPIEAGDPR